MQTDPLAQYRTLRKEGRLADAAALARQVMLSLEANQVAQLGKLLLKDLPAAFPDDASLNVLLLGQCTTNYLPALVTAWAWEEGLRVNVREGEYDQVVQELMRQEQAPDVVVLLPWNQRLLAHDTRTAEERIEDEMVFLQQSWTQVARLKSKLVQVSYDWVGAGALGYSMSSRRGGDIALVRQANASLHAALPLGAFFVDLEHVSAWHGKSRFYDERNYHWLKQPFSPEGLSMLAHKMAVGLRVLTTGRKKVLVLDLDNTLWGGVVGELGAHGIAIGGSTEGEAFLAFQKHVKRLKETGVILAACSKNNDADAREPFEKNEMMVLRLGDFAAFHASWDTKPARLRQIAQELNLGLDSFVFFDDNPAEREHVRAELPEVIVPEVPAEPALYIRTLLETLAFEAVDISSADAERSGQYAAEASRKRVQTEAATPEQYLASLEMRAEVQPVDASNLDRVVDLITKTNQFNLTTRRHSRAAVEEMAASSRNVCFAVKLADKFGDYGLIAVVLAVAENETTLRLDTWLMSCRAMGRTVEHFTLNHVAGAARKLGYTSLLGEYLPTAKNVPVKTLLPDLGFASSEGSETRWELDLATFPGAHTQVTG
jgi:FkbH-like protein